MGHVNFEEIALLLIFGPNDGGDGGDGDGGGGSFPRTLSICRALVASRPGTKYPVRGIPHFDQRDGTKDRLARQATLFQLTKEQT